MTPEERDRLVRLESMVAQMREDQAELRADTKEIRKVTDKMKSEQLYARAGLAVIVVLAGIVTWVINTAKGIGTMIR